MKAKFFVITILISLLLGSTVYADSYVEIGEKNIQYEENFNENSNYLNAKIVKNYNVIEKISFLEELATPIVSTILLTLAVVALVIELFLPTYGIAGITSLISFILFFGSNLAGGNSTSMNLLMFMIGVILLAIEAIIPGFGIPGIVGIVFVLFGITLSMPNIYIGLISVVIALISGITVGVIVVKKGYKSKVIRKIVLDDTINTYSNDNNQKYLGEKGTTLTPLRPSGTVEINSEKIDAITEGEFINKDTKIKVVKVEGFKVYVRSDV